MGTKFTSCKDCFYEAFGNTERPCEICDWSSRFIAKEVFAGVPEKPTVSDIVKSSQDNVNHPQHYTKGGIEVIDAIEAWGLNFRLANVIKYVARSDHKNNKLEDLKKARWYLDREISKVESSTNV
jgi:hypothetical protein